MRVLVIAHEMTDGFQAVYAEGKLQIHGESISASELIVLAANQPVVLQLYNVDLPCEKGWPNSLVELEKLQEIASEPELEQMRCHACSCADLSYSDEFGGWECIECGAAYMDEYSASGAHCLRRITDALP